MRKDVDAETIFYDAVLQDTNFYKRGAVVITEITQEYVKVQLLEKRSYQNFFPRFDEKYINELDLGEWPALTPSNITPQQLWSRWQVLLYEFDIDHKKGHISRSRTQENVWLRRNCLHRLWRVR